MGDDQVLAQDAELLEVAHGRQAMLADALVHLALGLC